MEKLKGLVDSILGKAKKYVNVKEAYGKAKNELAGLKSRLTYSALSQRLKFLEKKLSKLKNKAKDNPDLKDAVTNLEKKIGDVKGKLEKLGEGASKKDLLVVAVAIAAIAGAIYGIAKVVSKKGEAVEESLLFEASAAEIILGAGAKGKAALAKLVSVAGAPAKKVYSAASKLNTKFDELVIRSYRRYARMSYEQLLKERQKLAEAVKALKQQDPKNAQGAINALKEFDKVVKRKAAADLLKGAIILAIVAGAVQVYKSRKKSEE